MTIGLVLAGLGGAAYLAISGRAVDAYDATLIRRGDAKMRQKDYLAALGLYERILSREGKSGMAHLRAAAALDSMRRPVEAGWHYKDAAKFGATR